MAQVKKSGLGLLNPMISEKEKYLSYQWGSKELIWAVTGGGGHSTTLTTYCCSGNKNMTGRETGMAQKKSHSRV